ncbi:MAG: serine protease [Pseudooceanicola sp.]|nr:serine protease [Pseudooceanicola sp.]
MQIAAPGQSGNSGGPLIASDGTVVGVVVSKLDVINFASVVGDMPQNVNFAIRGELAQPFLSQNGIEPQRREDVLPLSPEDLAEAARAFTTFIECRCSNGNKQRHGAARHGARGGVSTILDLALPVNYVIWALRGRCVMVRP